MSFAYQKSVFLAVISFSFFPFHKVLPSHKVEPVSKDCEPRITALGYQE
jgi:hypothetical protein